MMVVQAAPRIPLLGAALLALLGGCRAPAALPPQPDPLAAAIPIDSLPFAIRRPGLYALRRDLEGQPGRCGILIESSGVTLDLGGHELHGGQGSLTGIRVTVPVTDLVVRNGRVLWWAGDAVDVRLASGCILEELEASHDGGDGIHAGRGSTLRSCRAAYNWFGRGFDVAGDCRIEGCEAVQNGFGGFFAGPRSELVDCLATGNTYGAGIHVEAGSRVERCRVLGNDRAGLIAGPGSSLSGCVSRDNASHAFLLSDGVSLDRCIAAGSRDGWGVHAGARPHLRECEVSGNARGGIRAGSGARIEDCRVEENRGEELLLGVGPERPEPAVGATRIQSLPYTIREPGRYALVRDLEGRPSGDGIRIEASGVYLDLRGCELRGVDGSLTGVLVTAPVRDLHLRNGRVQWWGTDAVNATLATDSIFEGLETSHDGGDGIHAGAGCRLDGCRASFNWYGIGLDVASDCIVADCTTSHNGFGGIRTGPRGRVEACLAEGNVYGVGIHMGEGSRAVGCRAQGNHRAGLPRPPWLVHPRAEAPPAEQARRRGFSCTPGRSEAKPR